MGYHTWFCPSPTTYFLFLPLPNEQKYEHFLTVLPGSMNVILCYTICNLSLFFLARSQFGFLPPKALPHYCNLLLFSLSLGLSHCIHPYHLSFSFCFSFHFSASSFMTFLKALLNSSPCLVLSLWMSLQIELNASNPLFNQPNGICSPLLVKGGFWSYLC